MGRIENIEIFEDTQWLYQNNTVLKDAVAYSKKHQRLILERDSIPDCRNEVRYPESVKIVVSRKRTFEAAENYSGKRVCVLNFASATNPGGGVVRGSSAQEECLCRCSTLYPNLDCREMWNGFYIPHRNSGDSLHNDDCIYTPDVMVMKTDTSNPRLMPEREWYSVNVLTCAAPNLRERPANRMNPGDKPMQVRISNQKLRELHEKWICRILNIAADQKTEVLILGAFGCGAFQNPPQVVAEAMENAVEQFKHCFETIEFAVYCPPGRDENYQTFKAIFSR